MGIKEKKQMTLDFEGGLCDRFQSLRECIATGVYRRGIGSVAIDLDQAPGNLSVQLSGDQTRHFSVDSLERYIEKSKDLTPIYYLIEKFVESGDADHAANTAEVMALLQAIAPKLKKLGID
ncbi:MAG: hypothetical protein ACXU8A_00135 [Burkholderiaceae bacterium]